MRGKVVSRVISEARRDATMTKSCALNFALTSPPILTILVVIRGRNIGFRLSNHLKQGTWRVPPRPPNWGLLQPTGAYCNQLGPTATKTFNGDFSIGKYPRMISRLGNIQWRLLDFARSFNCSFPNLLCLPFAFVDIFPDGFFFFSDQEEFCAA